MPEFSLADQLKGLSRTQKGEVVPETKPGEEMLFKVKECTFDFSTKKGTPGWTYKAEILDEGDFQGEILEGTAWFTTKGASLFMQQMNGLGQTEEAMSDGRSNQQIADACVGVIFKGAVRVDVQAGGRKRNQLLAVEYVGSDGSELPDTLDGGEDDFGGGLDEFAAVSASDGADDPSIPNPDGTDGAEPAALPASNADEDFWGSPVKA